MSMQIRPDLERLDLEEASLIWDEITETVNVTE